MKKKKTTLKKARTKKPTSRQVCSGVKQNRPRAKQTECSGVNVCICQMVGFLIMIAGCLGLFLIILWLYSCLPLGADKYTGRVQQTQTQMIIETDNQ